MQWCWRKFGFLREASKNRVSDRLCLGVCLVQSLFTTICTGSASCWDHKWRLWCKVGDRV